MRKILGEIVNNMRLYDYENADVPELSEEQRERLRQLGYIE